MRRIGLPSLWLHGLTLCDRISVLLSIAALMPGLAGAMEIQWTRMAGQWPVEATPLVADFSRSGQTEILVLNRGGQLLLWAPDGKAIGPDQDGLVCQLPTGRWTTAPTVVETPEGARLLAVSVEGLVVGLDSKFKLLWKYQLAGETGWGRAIPAPLRLDGKPACVLGDGSGTVTCLTPAGTALWTNALGAGPVKAPPLRVALDSSIEGLLTAAGSTLFCLDAKGKPRWRCELGSTILTRPELLSPPDRKLILCATDAGSLFALNMEGQIVWECPTGDTLNNSIALLPRTNAAPLILCPGLWGNLHAIDTEGHHVWSHLFRAKTRATPLVIDSYGDGRHQIYLPTFHQHVYVFDELGSLGDDVHLSGVLPSALTPILDSSSGHPDLLVTSTTLLGYRLRPSLAKSPYGRTGEAREVSLHPPSVGEDRETASLRVQNPHGALINVKLSLTDTNGWTRIASRLTARSDFEIPLPALVPTGAWSVRATAQDVSGRLLDEKAWNIPALLRREPDLIPPAGLRAWPTEPYGGFDEVRAVPLSREATSSPTNGVALDNIYQDEADQGAFIVASTLDDTVRARVTLTKLVNRVGIAFAGQLVLREVVATGSVNGERVPDALPKLGDAGLISIPPRRAVKIWVSVDARGAEPGIYTGRLTVTALQNQTNKLELPFTIQVLSLRLPREFPLAFCTWDYVPNRWFTNRTKEVLDDMARHGVNVFPRSIIPSARADAAGRLTIDWPTLDAELERLRGRGKILFHLNHPPIEFADKKTDAEKRPTEIAYILAFRDRLRDRGWAYEDYAFYLLDEPGLDNGANLPVLLDAGKLFRDADPKLRTYTDPVAGLSWKDLERITPLVDMWAPNMYLVSGLLSGDPRIQRIKKGKIVWSYECFSQVKSLSPLRYNRANAWRGKFFDLGGIGFWTHSTTDVDHWFAGKTINDEYALVYPGDLPVPSARWEAVRDGLEDVAAIVLLEQTIQRNRASGAKQALVNQAEEELRIAIHDIMELSDDAYVQSRDFLRAGDRVLGHTWTDIETFRHHRAEIARLTLALAAD